MRIVQLDASGWKTVLDFLTALKKALNAPEWCGSSVDAINELMIWGLVAETPQPPYVVQISGTAKAPKDVQDYIALTADCVREAREEKKARDGEDLDVSIKY